MNPLRTRKTIRGNGYFLHCNYRALSNIANPTSKPPEPEGGKWVASGSPHWSNLQNLLQKCARERAPYEGKACHGRICRLGLHTNTLTSNMLTNFYSKCGFVGCARKVFDELSQPSIVSWNTIIGAYSRNGDEKEALNLFKQMREQGSQLSEFTISTVICACAAKCAVPECKQFHAFALKAGMELNVFVGTALLDVYAKCNLIDDGCRVFESMSERSSVTWSSMMAGSGKSS